MKSTIFLVVMIIISVFLTVSNLIGILTSPIHSIINLIFLCGIVCMAILYGEQKQKEKFQNWEYNYDLENPNALVSGSNISGTVYSSYPNNTPGLGWIV